MAGGFFRELKHYKLYEISKELHTGPEETNRLVGILKKYGIVKSIKASKPEYRDLSNEDLVLTDVLENSTAVEYVFDFVGVVMVDGHVVKCYPKYISSVTEPVQQLKQVLKVIRKYNEKEQPVHLYNGGDESRMFNRLLVSLYLLEDYFQYGIYVNQHDITEINGGGEILWDQTINETVALIQNNRPYYVELQTQNRADDEMDYIRRLHACVLSQCTEELKNAGILELFDMEGVELTDARLDDFGDGDYIKFRLEREIQAQYITRKQILLKTVYTYVAEEKAGQKDWNVSLYGTNSFQLIWESVCAHNFGNVLDQKIGSLPLGAAPEYEDRKEESLRSLIGRPRWQRNHPLAVDDQSQTLRPDMICIYPCNDQMEYCFGIYDAKYYCIDFEQNKNGWNVTGQPGVEDVTKQYLYQLAYDDFIAKQGYKYVQNMFLCPQEEAGVCYGSVSMEMFHHIGNKNLGEIAVVKLCAGEMYDRYLLGNPILQEEIFCYIPKPEREKGGAAMILYINCCVRKESRTDSVARVLLEKLGGSYTELNLEKENLKPLTGDALERRSEWIKKRDYSDVSFQYAKQFAAADIIVVSAPYWDLSFPSNLKVYLENVYVTGIVSKYGEDAKPVGLCRAKRLYYITTAGGVYVPEYSFHYIRDLAQQHFGINEVELIKAEMLDVDGYDAEAIVEKVKEEIRHSFYEIQDFEQDL